MALTTATTAELDSFIVDYNIETIDDAAKPSLLKLSFAFLGTVKFCSDVDTGVFVQAQCFVIKAISEGFSPSGVVDSKTLVGKGLGRSAIVKKWEVNKDLVGTDSISMIKTIPMAYNLLKQFMCNSGGGDFNINLVR